MLSQAINDAVMRLEADWPQWQIWVVNRYIGGPLYCARRWDGTGDVHHGDTPGELTEYLEEAVSGESAIPADRPQQRIPRISPGSLEGP